MATDLERLLVQLSADIKGYERAMTRASGIMNKQAREIEQRAMQMNNKLSSIGKMTASTFLTPLAGIGAALSVREVMRYADAWTVAGNKLAAASQMSGMQARSLEELNALADSTRSGIEETVDLYAKLMRATAGVAKSENDVARATEIVNKAFKAGGAAASEQAAGILQLAQGLGSGVLQGDELRSIRENAPILAQAIADYYKTNIAGLKELGAQGQLTSEGVFKAILAAGPKIEAAFATTNSTIQDGITRVNNAFTQYIGQTDNGLSATERLVAGLNALADNFDRIADVTVKVAAIIAGALVGRSIAGMVRGLGLAATAVSSFVAAARTATSVTGLVSAMGGLSAAAGPLGVILGGTAVTAMMLYSESVRNAEERSEAFRKELEAMGLYAPPVIEANAQVAASIDDLTNENRLRRLKILREGLDNLKGGGLFDNSELDQILQEVRKGLPFMEGGWIGLNPFEDIDQEALRRIREIGLAWQQNEISAAEFYERAKAINDLDMSQAAQDLLNKVIDIAAQASGAETALAGLGEPVGLDEANQELENFRIGLEELGAMSNFADPVIKQMIEIIENLQAGEMSAEDAQAALEAVADANPDAAGFVERLGPIIGALIKLRDIALEAKGAVDAASQSPSSYVSSGRGDAVGEYYENERKTKEYIAEQERLQGLSKKQLALETEIGRVRKDALDKGVKLSDAQIKAIAEGNIAAEAARRGSGGGKGGSKAAERFDDQILKEIAAMNAETEALNRLTGAQKGYGFSVEKARKEAEILQDLQNKGITVTPELAAKVSELAGEWEKAARANEEANAKLERLEAIGQSVADSLSQAFEKAFTDPQGALKDLARELGMLALKMQLARLLPNVFGASGIVPLGFAAGGYTGAGGKYQPAGVVHRGEYVMDADTVRKGGGPAAFDALRRGIKGYAGGGYVGSPALPMAARAGGYGGGTSINVIDQRSANAPAIEASTERGPNGREIVTMIVKEEMSRGSFNGPMRGRYGINSQKVVR